MSATIEAVRGMHDVLPAEQRAATRIRVQLETIFALHGYQAVDLPIIESRDLYLRKLGEEMAGKVYEFSFGGRDLALRPEWTASLLRAYVTHMQDQTLPLRLCYAGPVFRYERPQRMTYRQFTQVGVEIIGAPAPRADAEALALACAGLDAAGAAPYQILVGHMGLVRQILTQLELTERTQGLLAWSLERLRLHGPDDLRARLYDANDVLPAGLELPPGLSEAQTVAWLQQAIRAMPIELATGTRTPEQVVTRLLRKLRRREEGPATERALAILSELVAISGPPSEALPALEGLLQTHGLTCPAQAELSAILDLLSAHDLDPARVRLDFGLGRGINYYTGLIFELTDAAGSQLCGGGRYDELVAALGGRSNVPAVGFAYGLERVVAAATSPAPDLGVHALVVPVSDEEYSYAQHVARELRAQGLRTTVELRGRGVARSLGDAARRGCQYVAIVGSAERQSNTVIWRDLTSRDEQRISLTNLHQV